MPACSSQITATVGVCVTPSVLSSAATGKDTLCRAPSSLWDHARPPGGHVNMTVPMVMNSGPASAVSASFLGVQCLEPDQAELSA